MGAPLRCPSTECLQPRRTIELSPSVTSRLIWIIFRINDADESAASACARELVRFLLLRSIISRCYDHLQAGWRWCERTVRASNQMRTVWIAPSRAATRVQRSCEHAFIDASHCAPLPPPPHHRRRPCVLSQTTSVRGGTLQCSIQGHSSLVSRIAAITESWFHFPLPVVTKRWRPTNKWAHNIQQERNKAGLNYHPTPAPERTAVVVSGRK